MRPLLRVRAHAARTPRPSLAAQVLGVVVIAAWSCTLSAALFWTLNKVRRPAAVGRPWEGAGGEALGGRHQLPAALLPAGGAACWGCRHHRLATSPPAATRRSLQLNWLRAPKDDEQQGLDLSQGIGSGLRASCFTWLPCLRD